MADRPFTTPLTEQAYAETAPLAYNDLDTDWSTLVYMEAILGRLRDVEELVRDSDEHPGYGIALDVDEAPYRLLDWLAQTVGVVPRPGMEDTAYRAYIKDMAGTRRGTPASVILAAQRSMTGMKTVQLVERDGSAYAFKLITYTAETPDPDQLVADVLTQKPAGLVFTHELRAGQNWGQLRDGNSGRTWAEVQSEYDSWEDARDDLP